MTGSWWSELREKENGNRPCPPAGDSRRERRPLRRKAAEGRRTPGRWRDFQCLKQRESVLERASPLALCEVSTNGRLCNHARTCPQ